MSVLDDTQILFEGPISGTGKVVSLGGMKIPGKMNPIPVTLKITKTISGPTTSLDIKLQQSDDGQSGWEDVPNSSVSVVSSDFAKLGRVKAVKYLPREVEKGFIKAVLAAGGGGTLASGEIFMALTREDEEPYESGLYFDKGRAEG